MARLHAFLIAALLALGAGNAFAQAAYVHNMNGSVTATVGTTERAAVATEISEEISCSLTALKFELAWLQRHWLLPQEAADRLANAIQLVDRTTMTAQQVVGNLRPAVLDEGIVAALEWLTSQFAQQSGIDTHFDANRDDAVDPATSIGIYRVCQEALSNVARHSGASRVDVHVQGARIDSARQRPGLLR